MRPIRLQRQSGQRRLTDLRQLWGSAGC